MALGIVSAYWYDGVLHGAVLESRKRKAKHHATIRFKLELKIVPSLLRATDFIT
jgi:hypothetical protein